MDSELSQAYYGVYCSSKEILKNNQRHLFCSMLDLLTSTCKTTGLAGSKIVSDELVHFWLADVLPLMFDKDNAIQGRAVEAFEQGLASLDVSTIHTSQQWPSLKSAIVSKHVRSINKLRDDRNPHWHRVWCFLLRILDREILKGASTINAFLSIVELGFRSADNKVRTEAFHCWRLLIQIFASHNELLSAKRMKLICIPLRSSQSKSAQAAEVKLRVWWYLITCLGDRLGDYFETVVEPFLVFCFGGVAAVRTAFAAKIYESVRELAVPCLARLLSDSGNEFLERTMRDHQLELLCVPSPLLEAATFGRHWRPLANSALEAIRLVPLSASESSSGAECGGQQLCQHLLRQLLQLTLQRDIAALTAHVCTTLATMPPDSRRVVVFALNTLAAEGIVLKRSREDLDRYSELLQALSKLFVAARPLAPPAILQRCVEQVFVLSGHESENGCRQWRVLAAILEHVLRVDDDDDYGAFETKLLIWRQVSQEMLAFLGDNGLDCRLKERSTLLEQLVLWPIRTCVSFATARAGVSFDASFCVLWRQLLKAGQHSPERRAFLSKIKDGLHELLKGRHQEASFGELFDAYVAAVLPLECDTEVQQHRDIFALLQEVLKQKWPRDTIETCLNTMRRALLGFKDSQIGALFDQIKATVAGVGRLGAKGAAGGALDGAFVEEWRRVVCDKLRSHPNKEIVSQSKELLRGGEVFVVIPSVWSLNPDKLTERQKERFAEKSVIPALYNDMSQSQDSSIKPWTPKKIVIAQPDKGEIVLEAPPKEGCRSDADTTARPEPDAANNSAAAKGTTLMASAVAEDLIATKGLDVGKRNRKLGKRLPSEAESKVKSPAEEDSVAKRTRNSWQRCRNEVKDAAADLETVRKAPPEALSNKENLSGPETETSKCLPLSEDVFHETESPTLMRNKESLCHQQTQLSGPEAVAPSAEGSISAEDGERSAERAAVPAPQQTDESIRPSPTEDLTGQTGVSRGSAVSDIMRELRDVSPKKTFTKFVPLSSPPDRKLTNNSTSPTLRPKPCSLLTGRGAQLINMIRNKKLYPTPTPCGPAPTATATATPAGAGAVQQKSPAAELLELTGTDHTSTPVQPKDLLVFSKRLPSPTASPSVSILKRKARCDSLEELSFDSPASKRKRVSFHDPPVSGTKEYVRDAEESKTRSKRCLMLEKCGSAEAKHALKRRSKLESIVEIEKYSTSSEHQTDRGTPMASSGGSSHSPPSKANTVMEGSMSSLKWHDSRNGTTENPVDTSVDETNAKQVEGHKEHGDAVEQMDTEVALKIVSERCSLEAVLGKFLSPESTLPQKSAITLAKFLSGAMGAHPKIKANVLEMLSEEHSKDFLDHAVQENLSSVVCDRLNLNSVIDYVCAKSKINSGCRNSLLYQIPDILKHSKGEAERYEFVKGLLEHSLFSDEKVLELIGVLIRYRAKGADGSALVSESAVDSSSNL